MQLRPEQQRITSYGGGLLAVSAVPGSGKTQVLAALVVDLLRRDVLPIDSEILIVTFTNSAVDNIKARVRRLLAAAGMPDGGYRVFTLHGLASAILRERPDLAGVASDFGVDNEISGAASMSEAARWFIQEHILAWRSHLLPDLAGTRLNMAEERWREETVSIGRAVTSLAKNLRLRAPELRALLDRRDPQHMHLSPFLHMGAAIYERYERILNAGGRLDFDDLIWGAIRALEGDAAFRARLSARYPFILEDEAQDSTPLQERILSLLSRAHGNWVRVGDPNQAIMTTFTSSDVRFFREFLARPDVERLPLSVSGRSAPRLIALANDLAEWCSHAHPDPAVRARALSAAVLIAPTQSGDQQPNPPDALAGVYVRGYDDDEEEQDEVVRNAVRYVRGDRSRTCCILAPTNRIGEAIVTKLERIQARTPGETLYQDQLSNTQPLRNVAKLLAAAVAFCTRPARPAVLVELYKAIVDQPGADLRLFGASQAPAPGRARYGELPQLLGSIKVERLLFPTPTDEPPLAEKVRVAPEQQHAMVQLGVIAARWLRASLLPIDQFLLTVAQDAFESEGDLALAHSLAVGLRRSATQDPNAQLEDFSLQLDDIAANRTKFMSSLLLDQPFEPVPGVITVTTLHKAKGLEWDGVFIAGADDAEFPDDVDGAFRGAAWYLGGREPVLEARTQLQVLVDAGPDELGPLDVDAALREAHIEYISERMRLLYVGITRARRNLILTWGRRSTIGRGREKDLAAAVRAVAREAIVRG